MLTAEGVEYDYREYTEEPLDENEILDVLARLGLGPKEVLRRRDKAFRALGLTGDESDEVLVGLMAANPTLLERPIGVVGGRAVVGRPPERLLELVPPTE